MPTFPGSQTSGTPLASQFPDQATVSQSIPEARLHLCEASVNLMDLLKYETGNEFAIKRAFFRSFYRVFDLSRSRKQITSNENYKKDVDEIKNWFNGPTATNEDFATGIRLSNRWVEILEDSGLI